MSNTANLPYANALAKTFPPPGDAKVFTAGPDAKKMLAFWSVKQTTSGSVLRIGDTLFRVVLHQCPNCEQHLSAQAVKMSAKEREMLQALQAMLKATEVKQAPSKAPAKKAAAPVKQAAVKAAPVVEEATELSEEEMAELDALTQPGGGS